MDKSQNRAHLFYNPPGVTQFIGIDSDIDPNIIEYLGDGCFRFEWSFPINGYRGWPLAFSKVVGGFPEASDAIRGLNGDEKTMRIEST